MYEFALEKEKQEHIWRRKRSKIFGEGKYHFLEEKKNGEKEGKEKEESIWRRKTFVGGEEKQRWKYFA